MLDHLSHVTTQNSSKETLRWHARAIEAIPGSPPFVGKT